MDEIKVVTIEDVNYPEPLRNILNAPKTLYYRGNFIEKGELLFGIVGTRKPSAYGQQVTLSLAGDLADAGLVIVSGMAPGIDTFAHRTCVEKKKRTVAVLGTGLDEKSVYPQENLELSRKIIEHGGCLISEFKPGTPGYPNNFRQRNRIVSGLSLGVLVVEAKEKSGSLITARYAKEQKKKLFAVPGSIYTLNAKGPNALIKEGATLVESAEDILDVLDIEPQMFAARQAFAADNVEESLILQVLKEEALYIDAIIERTKLNASVIATTLALMEISGKIRNLGGSVYSLN